MSFTSTRARQNVLAAVLLYVVAFLFILWRHPGGHRAFVALDDLFEIAAPVFACACGLLRAWRGRRQGGRSGRAGC